MAPRSCLQQKGISIRTADHPRVIIPHNCFESKLARSTATWRAPCTSLRLVLLQLQVIRSGKLCNTSVVAIYASSTCSYDSEFVMLRAFTKGCATHANISADWATFANQIPTSNPSSRHVHPATTESKLLPIGCCNTPPISEG